MTTWLSLPLISAYDTCFLLRDDDRRSPSLISASSRLRSSRFFRRSSFFRSISAVWAEGAKPSDASRSLFRRTRSMRAAS